MERTKSDSKRVAAVMTCPFCQEMVEGEYAMMLVRPSAFIIHPSRVHRRPPPHSTLHRLAWLSLMET